MLIAESLCIVLLLLGGCDGVANLDTETFFPFENMTTVNTGGYAIFGTEDGGYFGGGGTNLGDINGDGLDDLAIGEYQYNTTGRVVVVFGSNSTDRTSMTVETAGTAPNGFYIYHNVSEAKIGYSIDIGDLNADGKTDLLLGGSNADFFGFMAIVWGRADNTWTDIMLSKDMDPDIAVLYHGRRAMDYFGHSVASLGDFNNDSYPDFAVSVSNSEYDSNEFAGHVNIVFGEETPFTGGTLLVEMNSMELVGSRERETLGYGLDSAGDFNGDGIPDMVISSYLLSTGTLYRNGRVYVMFGSESHTIGGYLMEDFEVSDSTGFYIDGEIDQRNLGYRVSGGCDINNDGFDDVIIGSPSTSAASDSGIVVVLFGRASGFKELSLGTLSSDDGFYIITGDIVTGDLGKDVGCLGYVNDDEFADYYIAYTDQNDDHAVTIYHGSAASNNVGLAYVAHLNDKITNARIAFNAGNHFGEGPTAVAATSYSHRSSSGSAYIFKSVPPETATDSPTMFPTESPTGAPTMNPTVSPTVAPTMNPTTSPTQGPTMNPTTSPSESPTSSPSATPSTSPTTSPTTPQCDISITTTGGDGLTWDLTDDEGDEEIASGEFGGDAMDFTLLASEEYLLFLSSDTVPAGTSITVTVNGQDTVIPLEQGLTTSTEIAGVTCEAISNKIASIDSAYSSTSVLLALLMVMI